ncbi:MAG: DUF3786 domain-containing protein [Spirochaetaceae bacterium]|jgi:hypothetical protein|nr:DUF3786 domain-containing protein [Spirochaetaceae bacterium]
MTKGRQNGYEKTYETIRPLLRDLDISCAARRLGFDLISRDAMSVSFLGRRFRVTRHEAAPEDGRPVNVNYRSVLVYYAISGGSGDPRMDFAQLNTFSRGLFSGASGGAGVDWMSAPLRRAYGDDYPAFAAAARRLGMIYLGSRARGEHNWAYRLLPKIPVRLNYYEADDEFPAEVKIYYDKTVAHFLDFEPLAVLNGCFTGALAAAKTPPETAHDHLD